MAAPAGRVLGSMSMVDVAPDGTLWIAERCGANDCLANGDVDPILHVGADGEWLGAFGAGLFAWPHGIYVDAGGNVWVTDARGGEDRGHQVIKFAPDGRELLRLGTSAHAGDGPTHFNGPTDVVVAPNGNVFVSDGHEPMSNNRIVKFSADGTLHQGMGRHAAARRGSSSCRTRSRSTRKAGCSSPIATTTAFRSSIRTATSWSEWTQFGRPSGIHIAADDTLYVSDNQSNDERHRGLAARHLRRQREGRLRQRVHSGPGVRPRARARDRRARPRGRRRRHDLRRRGLFAEREEVRALTRASERRGERSPVLEQVALGERAVALELLDLRRRARRSGGRDRRCA